MYIRLGAFILFAIDVIYTSAALEGTLSEGANRLFSLSLLLFSEEKSREEHALARASRRRDACLYAALVVFHSVCASLYLRLTLFVIINGVRPGERGGRPATDRSCLAPAISTRTARPINDTVLGFSRY